MIFTKDLEEQLTVLAVGSFDQEIQIQSETPQGTLTCDVTAVDALACSVRRLHLQASATNGWDAPRLSQLSELLSGRLHYLLEPVSAVELDEHAAILQMRSNPPTTDEEQGRSYYELVAAPGLLELRRYHKAPGAVREIVPMTLTREVLGRLATDMVTAVAELV